MEGTVMMEEQDTDQFATDVAEHLTELRGQALKVLLFFLGVLGYCWLIVLIWLVSARRAPSGAWLSGACLMVGVAVTFYLRLHDVDAASVFIVCVVVASLAHAMITFRIPELAYLFVVPVALVGVLVGPRATGITAVSCLLLLTGMGYFILGLFPFSVSLFLPALVISLITLSSWLAEKNLYLSLTWALRACKRAQQKEKALRTRTGELRKALKALDEASYRLERTNYMLARARLQAEKARRLKQEFAQNISHELRTPLNLIIGFTKLMAQSPKYYGEPLSPAYLRDLSIVHRNAVHVGDLVNDVLDLARIEADQMGLALEKVTPVELVEEAVATIRSLIESRGLALYVEMDDDLPELWLDPTRIRQVLFNLLNNAARFTQEGGVTLRVKNLEDRVLFSVIDTGVGIAEEELSEIFQEFHQLQDRASQGQGGTGLGLAISRQFVEMHGGRIWVESEIGEGSTFSFTIPVQTPEDVVLEGEERYEEVVDVTEPKTDQRILLAVTKSVSGMGLLSRHLRDVRTVIAHDLQDGAEMARQFLPQAVFIDTCSVEADEEALLGVARRWDLPHIPFISCPLPSEESWRQRLTVDGYLLKPVERDELWNVLRRFGKEVDKILVVDDDKDFVRLLTRLLDNPVRRYQVHSAYTGREALDLLHRWQPDLLLLDLALPGMQGPEVVETMKGDPDLCDIPIVVVSGKEGDGDGQVLEGALKVTRASGLRTAEIVDWVQGILDSAIYDSVEEDRVPTEEKALTSMQKEGQ